MKQEWGASAGSAYRTKLGIDQGIPALLAIALLTLVIGAIVRSSVTEAHAAGWEIRLTEFVPKAMEQASISGSHHRYLAGRRDLLCAGFWRARHGHRRTYGH